MPIGATSDQTPHAGMPAQGRERRTTRRLDLAGRTDRGRGRERNEDQFVIAELGRWMQVVSTSVGAAGEETMGLQGTLLVVADGDGGHGGGDVASAVALHSLLRHSLLSMPWLGAGSPEGDALLRTDVETFVVGLEARLAEVRAERNLPRMLGTTLTAGYIHGGRLILAHVGASRAYVLRRGALSRLTNDQVFTETFDASSGLPSRSLVRVTPGDDEPARPELSSIVLESGDRILLCTDGLHGAVGDTRIAELFGAATSADEAVRSLVAEALTRGVDNVTVVAALG
jgi:PPM family protein phosphatase